MINLKAEAKRKDIIGLATASARKRAGKRARRLAQEGAGAKVVGGLRVGIKQLSAAQQAAWADKLLPEAQQPLPGNALGVTSSVPADRNNSSGDNRHEP
eukprot:12418958-Karenia_brevis.AAC.1